MLMRKVLYRKMTELFDGLFDEIIEERNREGDEFNIRVIDVKDKQYLIMISFYEFDETFIVLYDEENELVHLTGYNESDDTSIMTSSNIGEKIISILEEMLNDSLDYFEENYEFGVGFENVEVFDYDIKEFEETFNQELGDNKSIEIQRRTIVPKDSHKIVSVDKGMGQLIKKLSEQRIITMYSCVDGYISLYCFESQLNFVKECIESSFKNVKFDNDESKCWQPTEDGRRMYTFRW